MSKQKVKRNQKREDFRQLKHGRLGEKMYKCRSCNQKNKIISELKRKESNISSIQKSTKIPRSTLIYHLKRLEKEGILKRSKRKSLGNPVFFKMKGGNN